MSILVKANGSLKTHVLVDSRARTILSAHDDMYEAVDAMDKMKGDGAGDLAIQNITLPNCPDWIKEFVRSDREYCSVMAKLLTSYAAGSRMKAAVLVSEAAEYERRASGWSDLAEAPSEPSGPGI